MVFAFWVRVRAERRIIFKVPFVFMRPSGNSTCQCFEIPFYSSERVLWC